MFNRREKEKGKTIEATIPMCIANIIPCIFFTGYTYLIGIHMKSPLFWLGGLWIVGAGYCKVIWKFLLVIKHKDYIWLNKHFIFMIVTGLLMMTAGLFHFTPVQFGSVSYYMNVVPNRYFLLATVVCWVILLFMSLILDHTKADFAWLKSMVNIIATFCLFIGAVLVHYTYDYYVSTPEAKQCLEGSDTVTVTKILEGYYFDGPGTRAAVIMYPGALVETNAYAPLMLELAESGYDCFLMEMPMNLALFGNKKADIIQETYNYDYWYMAGHSLGGAMASSYVADRLDKYDGILLLAAYSTESFISEENSDFLVVSLYGSEDTVLNKEKVIEARELMPSKYYEIEIPGGNHAGFGSYGEQKGDSAFTGGMDNQKQIEYATNTFITHARFKRN